MEEACDGVEDLNLNPDENSLAGKAKHPWPEFDPKKSICPLFEGDAGIDDAKKIISIYLSKGTIITNVLRTSFNPGKRKVLENLIKKYKLKDHHGGDLEAVTVSRVAAAFPVLTITMLHSLNLQKTVSRDNFLNTRIELPIELSEEIFLTTIPRIKLKMTDIRRLSSIVIVFAIQQSKKLKYKKYCNMSDKEIFDCIRYSLYKLMASTSRNEEENETLAKKLTNIYVVNGDTIELTEDIIKIGDEARKQTKPYKIKAKFYLGSIALNLLGK